MTEETAPNIRLELVNLPENVSLVREMLAGVAEAVPLEDGQLDDMKTVVSEAANNVVLHAYDGREGPLEVEVYIHDGCIEVVVRDQGEGIRPRPAADEEEVKGIGLSVIQALTARTQFRGAIGEGTEVRMEFSTPGARRPAAFNGTSTDGRQAATLAVAEGATAVLQIAPVPLARRVLSRPVSALAARARFSIDRLSDVQLVADALTARAEHALLGGMLELGVSVEVRELELRLGPFAAGKAAQLVGESAVGGLDPLVETLADEIAVAPHGDAEVLTLRLLEL
ncbi:MAG: ATP-binding protein [Solirubrobacteraceae bacterium]